MAKNSEKKQTKNKKQKKKRKQFKYIFYKSCLKITREITTFESTLTSNHYVKSRKAEK